MGQVTHTIFFKDICVIASPSLPLEIEGMSLRLKFDGNTVAHTGPPMPNSTGEVCRWDGHLESNGIFRCMTVELVYSDGSDPCVIGTADVSLLEAMAWSPLKSDFVKELHTLFDHLSLEICATWTVVIQRLPDVSEQSFWDTLLRSSVGNIDEVIQLLEALLNGVNYNSHKPFLLTNLGVSLRRRFERFGEKGDIDRAISVQDRSLSLTPDGSPLKPDCLQNLGASLVRRFEQYGKIEDINRAISSLDIAVPITPDGPGVRNVLGVALCRRFESLGNIEDLDRSISVYDLAVLHTDDGREEKPKFLSNLGLALFNRFQLLGKVEDIRRAISSSDLAVSLTPNTHPEKPIRLDNLSNSLAVHFKRFGKAEDLDRAISCNELAVTLTPNGHPQKPMSLSNQGNLFMYRFEQLGNIGDINRAISSHHLAISLAADNHAEKPSQLDNLGISLMRRFERLDSTEDIDRAISYQDMAVSVAHGCPKKPKCLDNLGVSLMRRFARFGQIEDIDRAISCQDLAVEISGNDHAAKAARLSNLGFSLLKRFERLDNIEDVKRSISSHDLAVSAMPDGHPDKPKLLNNQAVSLMRCFESIHKPEDIDRAISALRLAISYPLEHHPNKPRCFSNLGACLRNRFEQSGMIDDLEDAISSHKSAVSMIPAGHPAMPSFVVSLGTSYLICFERLGKIEDIDLAISSLNSAKGLIPDDDPAKSYCLTILGRAFVARFNRLGQREDLDGARQSYADSAQHSTGYPKHRFDAAVKWAEISASLGLNDDAMRGYSRVIELLPLVAWLGLSIDERHKSLSGAGVVVCDAAAYAVGQGDLVLAVKWLEQGRSVVWGQQLQLRTPLDDVRLKFPHLGDRLDHIAHQMLHHGSESQLDSSLTATSEQVTQQNRRLAGNWKRLVDEVRSKPGFESFLRPPEIEYLMKASSAGPVVILNTSKYRCDALVLIDDDIYHIPLPSFSHDMACELQQSITNLTTQSGQFFEEDPQTGFQEILHTLWFNVVWPVFQGLAISSVPDEPLRLWWCPTGRLSFLPLHAAGEYGSSETVSRTSDFVISSYTPTLSALINAREVNRTQKFKLLLVAQPDEHGPYPIPATETEVDLVQEVGNGHDVVTRKCGAATKDRILKDMEECSWVHFACHGVQHPQMPVRSYLKLFDGNLELSEIVKKSFSNSELAFLSACETACGDVNISEEAVHLAAGMLLAGYRGVVATMWSISDDATPWIAQKFYKQLLDSARESPDCTQAARSLHDAVRNLRDDETKLEFWVPFIHIGV